MMQPLLGCVIMEAMAEFPMAICRVKRCVTASVSRQQNNLVNALAYIASARTWLAVERKPAAPLAQQAHRGVLPSSESNRRWCSDGFEFRCDNGEKLRVTFAMDCSDRSVGLGTVLGLR